VKERHISEKRGEVKVAMEDTKVKVKDENQNETKADEMVPDWLWGGEDPANVSMPVRELVFTDEKTVLRIYSLGRVISRVFKEVGLTFWTSSGTTLGIVRHKGLIPWDDDLDICVKEEDEPLLKNVGDMLEANGLCLVKNQSYSWRIFHQWDSEPISSALLGKGHRFPFCDIFVMRLHRGVWEVRDEEGRNAWPDETYSVEQVDLAEPRLFGDYLLPCPHQPEEYLDRNYGAKWSVQGATQWLSHDTGGLFQPSCFSIENFSPAKPFS